METVQSTAGNRHATFEFTVSEVPLTELSGNTTATGATPAGKPAPTPVKLFHGHEIRVSVLGTRQEHPCAVRAVRVPCAGVDVALYVSVGVMWA